eukprot:scaffold27979_cov28-Tisochrysis_lutea.AAC.1
MSMCIEGMAWRVVDRYAAPPVGECSTVDEGGPSTAVAKRSDPQGVDRSRGGNEARARERGLTEHELAR